MAEANTTENKKEKEKFFNEDFKHRLGEGTKDTFIIGAKVAAFLLPVLTVSYGLSRLFSKSQ